jgi:7,8-dihydro-6-hydroxymethylpterin dimethyltransferase
MREIFIAGLHKVKNVAKARPYLFYDTAVSLCVECLRRVEAKLVIQENRVWMYKWCPAHGHSKVLIASDAEYWRSGREIYIKPPEMPLRFNTPMQYGCPYDCGLCPDHMQHSCLTVVEITDHCNLRCPVCYANSGPHRPGFRDLAAVERMLDAVVANEGEPDVVQLSGGEPTLHPELFAILDAARRRPIKHLMLNTNGIRIANEKGFAERLAQYGAGFEVYLQWDSLRPEALKALRGVDLSSARERALDQLNRVGVSTTLVMTVARGVNDREIGSVIEYATKQRCVRGVTLQPVQHAGRTEHYDPGSQRLTLTEVRQMILDQTTLFAPADIIPVPCNPDALAMGYAIKDGDVFHPLTHLLPPEVLLAGDRNTIVFERDPALKAQVFKLFATNHGPEAQARELRELLCCLPQIQGGTLGYENVFRVLIMQFIDAWNFDMRAMKKSCVHIAQPDGRLIPFEAFNLLYRDGQAERLAELRREVLAPFVSSPASSGDLEGIRS